MEAKTKLYKKVTFEIPTEIACKLKAIASFRNTSMRAIVSRALYNTVKQAEKEGML